MYWDEWENTWRLKKNRYTLKSIKKGLVKIFDHNKNKYLYVPSDNFKPGIVLFKADVDSYTAEHWAANNYDDFIYFLDDNTSFNAAICSFYRTVSKYSTSNNELLGNATDNVIKNALFAHGILLRYSI